MHFSLWQPKPEPKTRILHFWNPKPGFERGTRVWKPYRCGIYITVYSANLVFIHLFITSTECRRIKVFSVFRYKVVTLKARVKEEHRSGVTPSRMNLSRTWHTVAVECWAWPTPVQIQTSLSCKQLSKLSLYFTVLCFCNSVFCVNVYNRCGSGIHSPHTTTVMQPFSWFTSWLG